MRKLVTVFALVAGLSAAGMATASATTQSAVAPTSVVQPDNGYNPPFPCTAAKDGAIWIDSDGNTWACMRAAGDWGWFLVQCTSVAPQNVGRISVGGRAV